MNTSPRKRNRSWYAFAVLCSTTFLAIVPIAAYGGLIIWSGDLGGPLNLILIPFVSVLLGGIMSLVIFIPLGFLSERLGLARVLRVVRWALLVLLLVAAVASAVLLALGLASRWLGLVSVATVVLAVPLLGFLIYLFILGLSPHENAA